MYGRLYYGNYKHDYHLIYQCMNIYAFPHMYECMHIYIYIYILIYIYVYIYIYIYYMHTYIQVILACFNTLIKLNPSIIHVWASILRRAPKAIIWLVRWVRARVCMYVCMHACYHMLARWVRARVCMYVCMHVCMYVCMHACYHMVG